MYFLYSLLLTIGLLVLLPRFALDALRHGKYITGLRERAGYLPKIDSGAQPLVWVHCVSVGEAQAARPLADALKKQFPSHELVISTTTLTGQAVARSIFRGQAAAVFYFPFDFAWTVRRALRVLNPAAVLLMETELWPRLLRECRLRQIPVVLVNGRISEKSFRGYRWIRTFMARVVKDLTVALMQSDADAKRINELGLAADRIHSVGNMKFDLVEHPNERELTEAFRRRFHFAASRPLIVAASTHAPEELIVLEAFKTILAGGHSRARLLFAPRHPERFSEVASILAASNLTWTRRSGAEGPCDKDCEVVLLDTIGEVRAVYPLACLVFVGGSIAPSGGHNLIEPAAVRTCIVTGPHTENFAAVAQSFADADALVQLPAVSPEQAPSVLARVFAELLSDDERRLGLGARALSVCESNYGATERTMEMLATVLAPARTGKAQVSYAAEPAFLSK